MLHIQSLGRYKEKDIYIDRLSFHKVEQSDLTNVLNATLMNLSPINFVLLTMLKVREEKNTLLVLLVFSTNRTLALDLCLVSMSRTHFEQNLKEFYNSQTPPSEEPGSTSTNTLEILDTQAITALRCLRT